MFGDETRSRLGDEVRSTVGDDARSTGGIEDETRLVAGLLGGAAGIEDEDRAETVDVGETGVMERAASTSFTDGRRSERTSTMPSHGSAARPGASGRCVTLGRSDGVGARSLVPASAVRSTPRALAVPSGGAASKRAFPTALPRLGGAWMAASTARLAPRLAPRRARTGEAYLARAEVFALGGGCSGSTLE